MTKFATQRGLNEALPERTAAVMQRLDAAFLNQYEIFEVHEGGFAYVLGVTDTHSGERLAVKIPKEPVVDVAEFAKEVVVWMALDPHPNIVRAHLLRMVQGQPVLFIEHIQGTSCRTVRELLSRGPLSPEDALQLAFQICLGMEFVNRPLQTVHLDLKPENLLLDDIAVLKITDFGLAHRVQVIGGRYETKHGGSWPYAAPERFKRQPCDSRADMFSIGVILYEMLTGRLPYPFELAEDPAIGYAQLTEFHARNGMVPVSNDLYYSGLPGVSSDSTCVLSALLEQERTDRPRDFGDVVSLCEGLGVQQNERLR